MAQDKIIIKGAREHPAPKRALLASATAGKPLKMLF